MAKICVLQTDNRPSLNYLLKTKEVNKNFCHILGYNYIFLNLDTKKYNNIHPATAKIYIVNDFLQNNNFDILIFLDSDAWIQDGYSLNVVVNNLINNEKKHGCFSRDPYINKNTFINSGSFIIKNNSFTKQMYSNIIENLQNNVRYHNNWPYDQYYISNNVFENKEKFVIFVPDILNTPIGKVLRHNWLKNKKMWNDLNNISYDISNKIFNEKVHYDDKCFPNILTSGYEYFC
jgi:hypothetical protein